MMDSDDDLSALIGQRVTEKRAALGLTLDGLAERTGVSRAMISRIERSETHASAMVLNKLCGGLGVSLSSLFEREDAPRSPLLRRADQPSWRDPASGYVRRDVAPPGSGSPVRIVEVDFPAGAEVSFDNFARDLIDQHIWLLEGEMELEQGGISHRLRPGDCLHMRLGARNTFRNPGNKPARYAVILTMEPRK